MKKFKIITIPFNPKTEVFNEDELNKFIFNKNIKNYQVQFFQTQAKSYWTVFLEYEPLIEPSKKESAALNESDKLFFEKLRVWRKETAEKAGVPVCFAHDESKAPSNANRHSPKGMASP